MRFVLVLAAVLVCVGVSWAGTGEAAGGPDAKAIVKGNNAFALDLYAKLNGPQQGNLFFSPYSISTALAMTYGGARGQTAAQMANVLHFDVEAARLHPAFADLVGALDAAAKSGNYELRVANALWVQDGYKILDEFLGLTQAHYGAAPHLVDFEKATEAARQTINGWVEKETKEKIKDLIPPGILTALTRLVLTNAIYFKGAWVYPFAKDRTRDEPFILLSSEKVSVPMMRQTERFGYLAGDGFQALEMPYKGSELSMVIFLPTKADGLPELEKSATAEKLAAWLGQLATQKVIVLCPRFKMTCQFQLAQTLKAMGMTDAFADAADFSGMVTLPADPAQRLRIGEVLHKAFVDVTETGTEAAAATAVVMTMGSAAPRPQPPIPVFRADHPFLFLIRDTRSGSILFLGRVLNPKE